MTDKQEGMEIEALGIEALGNEALGIEVLDLGDATIETRQYGAYPQVFDSIYILGERFG